MLSRRQPSDNQLTGHSRANTNTLPSGNVTSSDDSNSDGPSSFSSKGKSFQSKNRNDAPIQFQSFSPESETTPVVASADTTRTIGPKKCIGLALPCASTSSRTSPNEIADSRSRHSFSLRNASSHETLFIGFAHMSGVKKAQLLAKGFEWKFDHPVSELITIVDELNRDCIIIDRKKAEA